MLTVQFHRLPFCNDATLGPPLLRATARFGAALEGSSLGSACILGRRVGLSAEGPESSRLLPFGILIVGGTLAFGLRPSLRSKSRVIGFVGAVTVTVVASLFAGWLETNF